MYLTWSLSARRAWIEIYKLRILQKQEKSVALRKESVDRNSVGFTSLALSITSLSARRAWIEIFLTVRKYPPNIVALRKESVDRNSHSLNLPSRPIVALRKESVDRNLVAPVLAVGRARSLSARRAWIEIRLLTI